jgi:hypothetical protein
MIEMYFPIFKMDKTKCGSGLLTSERHWSKNKRKSVLSLHFVFVKWPKR